MTRYAFVKPYDVFMPRGNQHFGVSSGDFGQIRMLPAPSIFAGAFRSFLASRNLEDLERVENRQMPATKAVAESLGSLAEPGNFRIAVMCVCKAENGEFKLVFPLPADLVIFSTDQGLVVRQINPELAPACVDCQRDLPEIPVLRSSNAKPAGGYWLTEDGFRSYLNGKKPQSGNLLKESDLWKKDMRIGLALDANKRTAEEGKLYSAEVVSFLDNVGFLIGIDGADSLLKEPGDLILGGDMRAANFKIADICMPQVELATIEKSKKFKLLLTSPAIFANGWLPDHVEKVDGTYFLKTDKFSARLVCASIKGHETVSGWNLAEGKPKDAVRTVPTGSIYWFRDFEGDLSELNAFCSRGIWQGGSDKQRMAEGYNRATLAAF